MTKHRNRVVHAIALNQCTECGEATMFRHPASGDDVDRSPEAVTSVVARYEALRANGVPLATALSEAVTQRIFVEAKKIGQRDRRDPEPAADLPPPCGARLPNVYRRRGNTIIHGGTAIAVIPTARWDEFRDGLRRHGTAHTNQGVSINSSPVCRCALNCRDPGAGWPQADPHLDQRLMRHALGATAPRRPRAPEPRTQAG